MDESQLDLVPMIVVVGNMTSIDYRAGSIDMLEARANWKIVVLKLMNYVESRRSMAGGC